MPSVLDGGVLASLQAFNIKNFDYDVNNNLIYFGSASPESADSDAMWQIMELIYDASNNLLTIKWANGNASFVNIWDDRTSLSYS